MLGKLSPDQVRALKTPITVVADGIVWMSVLGNLDLALKHPANVGTSSDVAKLFAESLREKLKTEGVPTTEDQLREQNRCYAKPAKP